MKLRTLSLWALLASAFFVTCSPVRAQISGQQILPNTIASSRMTNTGVTAGSYGDAAHFPIFTVDSAGRLTLVSVQAVSTGYTLPYASTSVLGGVFLTVAPASSSNPLAVGDNDPRMTNSRAPSGTAGGDLTGSYPNPTLAAVGTSGTFGDASHVPVFTVDSKGRITGVSLALIGTGNAITALTGDGTATGPGSASFTLATVNPSPGTTGDASHVSQTTTNGKGLVTANTSVAISILHTGISDFTSSVLSLFSGTSPITYNSSTGAIGLGIGSGLSISGGLLTATGTATYATVSATAPTSPVSGQQWYDTGTSKLKTWTGSAWSTSDPIATTSQTGTVEPDGTSVTISGSGVISAPGSGITQVASDPTTPAVGVWWENTTTHTLKTKEASGNYWGIQLVSQTLGKPASGTAIDSGLSISSGIVLAYPMNEGTGTTLTDRGSGATNGTLSSSTQWSSDATYTKAVTFNGSQTVTASHSNSDDLTTLTVATAFKTSQTSTGFFYNYGTTSGGYPISMSLYVSNGIVGAQILNSSGATQTSVSNGSTGLYDDGNWHSVICTYSSTAGFTLYVDSATATTAAGTTTTVTASTNSLLIGKRSDGPYPLTGSVGYLTLWNRILSSGEITTIKADPFAPYR